MSKRNPSLSELLDDIKFIEDNTEFKFNVDELNGENPYNAMRQFIYNHYDTAVEYYNDYILFSECGYVDVEY